MKFLHLFEAALLAPLATPTSYNSLTYPTVSKSSLLSLHQALVETPSISGSEYNVSLVLIDYLQKAGFTVQTQAVAPERQNVLAYVGQSNKTRVLVTSHIDTVPPYYPYERKGDEIWGRGSVDAKGSVASQIIAVESLLQSREIQEGDVALLYVVGEERGGAGMLAANALGLSWEAVIFGEPTELKLASGHKGVLGLTATAKGKAGHSGYPESGKNALDILVKALSVIPGIELPWSERYGNTTINLGTLQGGVAANVIPENANATLSVRVAVDDVQGLTDLLNSTILAASPEVQLSFPYAIGPVAIDSDIEGFEKVVQNYGTDIPSLKGGHKRYLYGPGTILVAHSDHEHLNVSDLENAVGGYQTLIKKILAKDFIVEP
ncbi:hypothetical protein B0O99DRAFT_499755 [Bisporella sp. PMI_857]|nr:hypothetical protein B0O99DRAFT_499755 [Bisporella sp. PMI_857]